jgi:uncharacterized protein (DUF169 family)
LEIGSGGVFIGASGGEIAAAQMTTQSVPKEGNCMVSVNEFNKYGEQLEKALILRTLPVAVKMLEKESDIPKEAMRPKKDRGCHIAQCQAFALSRREGTTVAMLKEDHWCPTAMMAYGLVDRPDSVTKWTHPYKCFEKGKYIGMVTAPLKSATFAPDVVLVYSNPAQLRSLLLSMKIDDVPQVGGNFFPPSCGHSIVNPINTGQCFVVIPDPGEYQRALTQEEEMIFSVPHDKMPGLMAGLKTGGMFSYRDHNMSMLPDFEQPEFYKDLFKGWGLDTR